MSCNNSLLPVKQNTTNEIFQNMESSLEFKNVADINQDLTEFDNLVKLMPPKSVNEYLQIALLFLKGPQTMLHISNIAGFKESFLIKIVENVNNLSCSIFDDFSKQIAKEISEILLNNKDVYQWVSDYEFRKCSQKNLVFKKIYLKKTNILVNQGSDDHINTDVNINGDCKFKTQEGREEKENMLSSSFKVHWLTATLKFIKNNNLKALEYPEMPLASAEFIESLIHHHNKEADLCLELKSLYASVEEAMTIFKLKYEFILKSVVKSNETVQLTLEKIPKKHNGIQKTPVVPKNPPKLSVKRLNKLNKLASEKMRIIEAVPMNFVMNALRKVLEFVEDVFSASLIFKDMALKEWTFLMNVKAFVKYRHILTELPPTVNELLERIDKANVCGINLTLNENRSSKNNNERTVTFMKLPKFYKKMKRREGFSPDQYHTNNKYSSRNISDMSTSNENSPSNTFLKALTRYATDEDPGSASFKQKRTQSTSRENITTSDFIHTKSRHLSIDRRPNSQLKSTINFQSAGSLASQEAAAASDENLHSHKKERGRTRERHLGRMKSKLLEAMSVPLESDRGLRIMKLMGWNGGALGTRGEGITEPIIPVLDIVIGAGLGHDLINNRADTFKRNKFSITSSVKDVQEKTVSGAVLGHEVTNNRADTFIGNKSSTANSMTASVSDVQEKTATSEVTKKPKLPKKTPIRTRIKILGQILDFICSSDIKKTIVFEKRLLKNERRFFMPAFKSFNERANLSLKTKEENDLLNKIRNEMLSKREIKLEASLSKNGWEIELSKIIYSADLQTPIMKRLEKRLKKVNQNNTQHCSQKESDIKPRLLSLDTFMSSMECKEQYGVYSKKSFTVFAFRLMMLEEVLEFLESEELEVFYYTDFNISRKHLNYISILNKNINERLKDKYVTAIEESFAEQIWSKLGNCYFTFDCDRWRKLIQIKKLFYENKFTNSTNGSPTLLINDVETPTMNGLANSDNNEPVEVSRNDSDIPQDTEIRESNLLQPENSKEDIIEYQDNDCKETASTHSSDVELIDEDIEVIVITSEDESVISIGNEFFNDVTERQKDGPELENAVLELDSNDSDLKLDIFDDSLTSNNKTELIAGKRLRSDSESTEIQNAKKTKLNVFRSYKDVCIIPNNSDEKITLNCVQVIHNLISNAIDDNESSLPLLECHGIIDNQLVYSCYNEHTYTWLIKAISDKFMVVDSSNINRLDEKHRVQIKLNSVIDGYVQKVLNRIKLYNSGLDTGKWTVINKMVYNNFTVIDVEVDDDSFKYIRQCNFSLFAGVDKAKFSLKWN